MRQQGYEKSIADAIDIVVIKTCLEAFCLCSKFIKILLFAAKTACCLQYPQQFKCARLYNSPQSGKLLKAQATEKNEAN